MPWYAQLILYCSGIFISFMALSNLEWAKITRISRREFVWFAYIVISLAVGFIVGLMMINIVDLFLSINKSDN